MGNEASLEAGEGGGAAGQPLPSPGAAASAPARGQLPGPSSAAASPARHIDLSAPGRLENSSRLAGQSSAPQTFRQTPPSTDSTKEMKSHVTPSHQQPDVSRRTLQVGSKVHRTGRSPSASPDRGTTPTSPYSVPQIAPLPSRTLCPICNTTDLTSSPNQPNFNKCTQCHNEVCNQCGFNPNPHLTEVKEWLCLNCQMQRALGMDMTTATRSKSQQQLHSPLSPSLSPAKQAKPPPLSQSLHQMPLSHPQPQAQSQPQPQQPQIQHHSLTQSQHRPQPQSQQPLHGPSSQDPLQSHFQQKPQAQQKSPAPIKHHSQPEPHHKPQPQLQGKGGMETSMENIHSLNMSHQPGKTQPTPQREQSQGFPKPAAPQDISRSSPQHSQAKPSLIEQRKTPGSSPAKTPAALSHGAPEQGQEGLTGKLFGFGASLLNQASTLISVPETTPQSQQSPSKVPPKIVFSDASKDIGTKAQGSVSPVPSRAESSPLHWQGKSEQIKPKDVPKVLCPLCKTDLNVGSSDPANYNSCTACKKQVCNMCGFNPTPHLVEKNEWLCLNCQTQRLLEGSLGDTPPALPSSKQGSPRHQPGVTPTASPKHLPGALTTGSPRHQTGSGQTAPPYQQKAGPSPTASPQHQPVTAGQQQQRAVSGHGPETAQDKRISQSSLLRSSEHVKTQPGDRKYPEEITQPKAPAESQKVSKQLVPKGKSLGNKKETVTRNGKSSSEIYKTKDQEDKNYYHDVSRSPQSLSDTGYSSDGISSSQSEIAGLVQQEEEKLNATGISQRSPPSPSELTKLESSVRPLLESKSSGDGGKSFHGLREEQKQKQRPKSLSITPEAFDSDEELEDILEEDEDSLEWENQRDQRECVESSDDFGSKLRHDYVEDSSEGFSPLPTRQPKGGFSDEEFMRRQLLEMSAEEDNLEDDDEQYNHVKYSSNKNGHKTDSEKAKGTSSSKRSLAYSSNGIYDENRKDIDAEDEEDISASQGGLRRFKTIDLNSTNSYNRDMDLDHEADISLDREPELEMESLTGSPEERSRGEYSSTLPATTPSYTSGTSPTSLSSLEEDSDSSPSRRQRLEEVKQQRKARHRSHGPLLPTIEDSSEEEELREEEELLREQEKMREVEQQRIRSTARKTKRDKEELRAQRRRERSKTPPSNLSPIEDASPTEEMRQAAEMEELHRSSCSEYSPSIDSEAEGFEIIASKLYKSGSEYNLPTFMSLYSPTEKTPSGSSNKPLKSAEEVYEEMMRKAEMFQKQQQSQQNQIYGNSYQQVGYVGTESQNNFEYQYIDDYGYNRIGSSQNDYQMEISTPGTVYDEILQTSQNISRMHQSSSIDLQEEKKTDVYAEKQFLNAENAYNEMMKQVSGSLTPGTSPTQLSAPVSFASSETSTGRIIPDVRVTQHFSKDGLDQAKLHSSSTVPSSKTITSTYQYGKMSTATTSTSMASSGNTEGTSALPTQRGYGQSRGTSDYSSNEEQYRNRTTADASASSREHQQSMGTSVSLTSKVISFFKSTSPPLSPTSPTQSPTHSSPRISMSTGSKNTAEFSSQTQNIHRAESSMASPGLSSPMVAQGTQTPERTRSPRLARQQSSQEGPFMVITLASDSCSQTKPKSVSSSTSPVTSPTRVNRQQTSHSYSQTPVSSSKTQQEQMQSNYTKTHTVIERAPGSHIISSKGHSSTVVDGSSNTYNWGSLPPENISLCRISSIPGTSRVEPGPKPTGSAVDLRTAMKSAPVIMTDQGMDLTSIATETRRYSLTMDQSPVRQSTAVQPLIVNLNAQEQPHAVIGTATTVSITVASSMIVSQPKQPMVYGDPFQNRVDFGQGTGNAVCLTQVRQVEQAGQVGVLRGSVSSGGIAGSVGKPEETSIMQKDLFARYNLPSQVTSVVKRDIISQPSNINVMPRQVQQDQGMCFTEAYKGVPEPKAQHPSVNIHGMQPHTMMVHMDETVPGTVTKLLKEEPTSNALDLTGIKPESQVACCDVVYKFPFAGSCAGSYTPKIQDKSTGETAQAVRPGAQYYGQREQELTENYQYRESKPLPQPPPLAPAAPPQNVYEEQKFYPYGPAGRLHSSMSETNLSDIGLYQPYQAAGGEGAMDLSTMKNSYSMNFTDGNYMAQGLQYGSFTDLRQPTDFFNSSLPMRRYSSMSNIYSDYRYSSRDLSNFQESSLAQYSATTAREISRMCAALNSMDQYGGRHTNSPDLLQYGPNSIGPGPAANILPNQQGMASIRQNMMYAPHFSETRQGFGSLGQYNISGSRTGVIRQMYPSAATVRAADGMIYSTINTPIASTLPITTQPASVLRPMIRGLYRPYGQGSVTAVPLASLTRVPLVAPRMPLGSQPAYRYPGQSRVPPASSVSTVDTPVYLGKPASTFATSTATCTLSASTASSLPISTIASTSVVVPSIQPEGTTVPPSDQLPVASSSKDSSQPQQQPSQKSDSENQTAATAQKAGAEKEEKEKEEERQRKQQEHLLQIERERVEIEALRQMRLHEELERERLELQRHREKEQMLVQRELQELQSIKHQVLQQQQEERQAQFAMQREQLAQQRLQLEQIQQLQQQLQQQLEEQKRQKTAIPPACEQTARLPPQAVSDIAIEMQRTLAQSGQYWPPMNQPFIAMAPTAPDAQVQPRYQGSQRPLTNSASEMSLQTDEQWEVNRTIKKRNSMPRLRDAYNTDDNHEPYIVKKITDSSVQTDDEDGEERFYMSRRRRTKRSTDCSVQTDDEDNAEWDQPVRRRRSRFSRHSDSSSDSKHDTKGTSSIAIQTISDCSVQTEPDQLQRVSPSIHITTPDPKVEIIKYISAPEKTQKGESLACQTEPETQSHGIVVPQLSVPTTVTPYSSNIHMASSGPLDGNILRQQGSSKFEKKKPDPLEIGYQSHLPADTLSQLVNRQPPKSPHVLYSPVSPLSPHRLLESTFASSERLNKAHVTPQKHFTAESIQRQQILPRPIKTIQRSLSDPKPISPTSEESAKDRFSLYQHQLLQSGQISAFQSNTLTRKVKRTLPSPPPDEGHLPLTTSQAHSQMYMSNLSQKFTGGQTIQVPKVGFMKTIDHDLKIVEQESTKLRKQQAELEEEEKEIDAKLKYLELGITQRKESLVQDRGGRRDFSYLRCLGENRDYMSDSELNNIRISGYDSSGLLNRTGTTHQYSDFQNVQQFHTSTSSYTPSTYQYTAGQSTAPVSAPLQQTRFQQPQYPVSSNGPSQNSFQTPLSGFPAAQSSYQTHNMAPTTGYQSDLGMQNQTGFRPPNPYQAQTTYSNQTSLQTTLNSGFQPPADTQSTHQKPRQTSLADLEHKVSTNYEVIGNPTVVISSATPDSAYSSTTVASNFDQYKSAEVRQVERGNGAESPSNSYSSDSHYANLEQNIPRNYVMIEDISELTKENPPPSESQKVEPLSQSLQQNNNGRHMKEKNGHLETDTSSKPCCYSRAEEESEEDVYDHHSSDYRGRNNYHRSSDNNGRDSVSGTYYYGENDSRHSTRLDKQGPSPGMQKHSSKNLAPAVVSSKRSKHRKQGMEQKISKFSPIEEAKDVESDLAASYPVTTPISSSVSSRAKKLQDEITYGLKKNVYEQQKYYSISNRDMMEEDDRIYGSGNRSRSASSYGLEKSSRESGSSRSKSYERDATDRYHKSSSKPSSLSMSQSRGRAPMRTQASEEESPVSPLGKSVGGSRSSGGTMSQPAVDSCSPFCSSHSLPDVQEHAKEVPRNHTYKQEESYMMDDSHCVVSDSEAYHLGQEETDWFDKPREVRSDRSRYYSSHSSQKKIPVKHTYHDYDEPPDDDMWQHDEYSQPRHSSSKEHRHHGESGRHSSSSRHLDEQQRRSSKHPREQGRHESRPHSQPSSTMKKSQQSDSRSQSGYPSSSSDYSQQPRQSSGYHHGPESQKSQRQSHISQQQKTEPQSHHQVSQQGRQSQSGQQQQTRQPQSQQQSSRQQQQTIGSSQASSHQSPHQSQSHQTSHQTTSHQTSHQQSPHQQGLAQPAKAQAQQQPQHQQQQQQQPQSGSQVPQTSRQQQPQQPGTQGQGTTRAQQQPQQAVKPQPTQPPIAQPAAVAPKVEPVDSSKAAPKPTPQLARGPQPSTQVPSTGVKIGQKAAPPGAAAAGQPGAEGESMFSKILPGNAAEQAGKLTEAVSAFGKKFSSFW